MGEMGLSEINEKKPEWVCSDCGAPSEFVKTGFLDNVKPQCTKCGGGNAKLE